MIEVMIVMIVLMTFIVIIVMGMVWSSIQDTLASFEEGMNNHWRSVLAKLILIEQDLSGGVVEGGVLPERRPCSLDERDQMTKKDLDDMAWTNFPHEGRVESMERVTRLPKDPGYTGPGKNREEGRSIMNHIYKDVEDDIPEPLPPRHIGYVEGYEPVHVAVVPAVSVKAVTGDGEEIPLEPGDVLGNDPKREPYRQPPLLPFEYKDDPVAPGVCPRCRGMTVIDWNDPTTCPVCKGTGRLDGINEG